MRKKREERKERKKRPRMMEERKEMIENREIEMVAGTNKYFG